MKKVIYLLSAFVLISCYPNQKIAYNTKKLTPENHKTIPITVEIRELKDLRKDISFNDVLFTNNKQVKLEGKQKCINSEKYYKKEAVTVQVSRMMAEHFNKVELFNQTTYNQIGKTDYYLTGELTHLFGKQDFSTAAAVGSQFGLIGAIATTGIKTQANILIEIKDLKLYKKDGTLVKDFGNIRKEYDEKLKADGYCWCAFWSVNEKLQEFNSDLVNMIRKELSNVSFKE